ncbi:caffeoyl-CoA O-methyltransferase [Actinacidiphila rubida]|uniref:Caffeoyl-CoA O-methyltransferase n=2 Tax=Actinacidiphila rubida TaxID=310780 RepID=A0A1H8FE43_9ACTN|nr:class I SAM-dependent methyltransferase [Actinacidiphila rubida]SEN29457.1 caffeoyl-CoA O-methyltransferase [Actinacidiphila rubida]
MHETKNPQLTPELYQYVLDHNPPLDAVQRDLVASTQETFADVAGLQTAPEQAPLLSFLVMLTGARQIVEVGTFTGFSTLALARALPADGRLIACDVSEEWTALGRTAWAAAGVADRIDLRLAPAIETLRALPEGPWIDLAFLDADKGGYLGYWEELVPRLRPGGLLVVDNTLFHGDVVDPAAVGSAAAVRAFNDRVAADDRVDHVLLTVADGLTLARRR